ncbi:MAG: hypothetical protein ACFFG0_47965 [Candidatus Thorarchaeota archaeon]
MATKVATIYVCYVCRHYLIYHHLQLFLLNIPAAAEQTTGKLKLGSFRGLIASTFSMASFGGVWHTTQNQTDFPLASGCCSYN